MMCIQISSFVETMKKALSRVIFTLPSMTSRTQLSLSLLEEKKSSNPLEEEEQASPPINTQKLGWISRLAARILRLLSFRRRIAPSKDSNGAGRKRRQGKGTRHRNKSSSSALTSSCSTSSSVARLRVNDAKEYLMFKSAPELSPFFSDYILRKTVGLGSFSKVHLALHKFTHAPVAIKVVHKKSLGDDLPRVYIEIEALKVLDHPNICKLYQIYESPEYVFMSMEFCSTDLFNVVNSSKRRRLKEERAKKIFYQLVSAVAYVHSKGFVHRDLKLENVLLDMHGNVKLIDFNLAARIPKLSWNKLHTLCGTIEYAAPELLRSLPYDGKATDCWSLGILLYIMLCGKLPFDKQNVRHALQCFKDGDIDFPKHLSHCGKRLIENLLKLQPESRIRPLKILQDNWLLSERLRLDSSGHLKHISDNDLSIKEDDPLDPDILNLISSEIPISIEYLRNLMSTRQPYATLPTTSYTILKRKKSSMGSKRYAEWETFWKHQRNLYRQVESKAMIGIGNENGAGDI